MDNNQGTDDNMTIWDIVKKNKIKIILIAISVCFIPLLVIHLMFKIDLGNYWIYAEWTAGDLIGYTAGILAFIGTITLGFISIWQTDRANKTNDKILELTKESERKSVLPFLSFNIYFPKFKGDILASLIAKMDNKVGNYDEESKNYIAIEDDLKREESLIKEIYFTITNQYISISDELNDEQKKKIQSEFDCIITHGNQGDLGTVGICKYKFIKLYVENCGRGSAINMQCRFYKKGIEGRIEGTNTFDVYSVSFSLPCSQHLDLGLYFDTEKEVNGEYELEFNYQDIYMNVYTQKIPISLNNTGELTANFNEPQIKKLQRI